MADPTPTDNPGDAPKQTDGTNAHVTDPTPGHVEEGANKVTEEGPKETASTQPGAAEIAAEQEITNPGPSNQPDITPKRKSSRIANRPKAATTKARAKAKKKKSAQKPTSKGTYARSTHIHTNLDTTRVTVTNSAHFTAHSVMAPDGDHGKEIADEGDADIGARDTEPVPDVTIEIEDETAANVARDAEIARLLQEGIDNAEKEAALANEKERYKQSKAAADLAANAEFLAKVRNDSRAAGDAQRYTTLRAYQASSSSTDINPANGAPSLSNKKRPITLTSQATIVNAYNKRKADGSFEKVTAGSEPAIPKDAGLLVPTDGIVDFSGFDDRLLQYYDECARINGEDFYNPEKEALGTIPTRLALILPYDYEPVVCDPIDVGRGLVVCPMDFNNAALVYHFAKEQALLEKWDSKDAIKFAHIRVEALKAGWYDNQQAVIRRPIPSKSLDAISADAEQIIEYLDNTQKIAFFVPFLMEFAFRAYGSGWNSSNAVTYGERFEKILTSCGYANLASFMNKDIMFRDALHWVGPKRVMDVLVSENLRIPEPIKLRATAPPSGVAIVTTALAVIQALESANAWADMAEYGGYQTTTMETVARKVHSNPFKYHRFPNAYALPPLNAQDKAEVTQAKLDAARMAPVLQAFIECMPDTAALKKAKVLIKPANENPLLQQRAKGAYKKLGGFKATTLTGIFIGGRAQAAAARQTASMRGGRATRGRGRGTIPSSSANLDTDDLPDFTF